MSAEYDEATTKMTLVRVHAIDSAVQALAKEYSCPCVALEAVLAAARTVRDTKQPWRAFDDDALQAVLLRVGLLEMAAVLLPLVNSLDDEDPSFKDN